MKNKQILLGVNIDHAATLRQARFTPYPDLSEIVRLTEEAGADGITLHLREDRRHIQDDDVTILADVITTKMNFEMAATDEMVDIALALKPADCCIVPESRQELTTEGGLDVLGHRKRLEKVCIRLSDGGINASIFIEPDIQQIQCAADIGAPIIELHTGSYANLMGNKQQQELVRLTQAAEYAHSLGLIVNAGHGLDYTNVQPILGLPMLNELNIGHSIISRALVCGISGAVNEMKQLLVVS